MGWDVLSEATWRVNEATRKVYAELTRNLPELCAQILQADVFAATTTALGRKAAVRVFLQEHSGGYPPSNEFAELVAGHPLLKKPRKQPPPQDQTGVALWHE